MEEGGNFVLLCQEVVHKGAPNVRTAKNYNCIIQQSDVLLKTSVPTMYVLPAMYVNESALGSSVA